VRDLFCDVINYCEAGIYVK